MNFSSGNTKLAISKDVSEPALLPDPLFARRVVISLLLSQFRQKIGLFALNCNFKRVVKPDDGLLQVNSNLTGGFGQIGFQPFLDSVQMSGEFGDKAVGGG